MSWIVIHKARKNVYYGPFAYYTEAMDFRNKKRSLYANDGLEVDLNIEPTIEIAPAEIGTATERDKQRLAEREAQRATAFDKLQRERQTEIDAAAEAAIKGSPDAFRG